MRAFIFMFVPLTTNFQTKSAQNIKNPEKYRKITERLNYNIKPDTIFMNKNCHVMQKLVFVWARN